MLIDLPVPVPRSLYPMETSIDVDCMSLLHILRLLCCCDESSVDFAFLVFVIVNCMSVLQCVADCKQWYSSWSASENAVTAVANKRISK
jgi:hypothetical protein